MAQRVTARVPLTSLQPDQIGATITVASDGQDYRGEIIGLTVYGGEWLVTLDIPDDVVLPEAARQAAADGVEPGTAEVGPIPGAAPHETVGTPPETPPGPEVRRVPLGAILTVVKRTMLCDPRDLRDLAAWLTARPDLGYGPDLETAVVDSHQYLAEAFPDLVALPDPPDYTAPGRNEAAVTRLHKAYVDGIRDGLGGDSLREVTAPAGPLRAADPAVAS